MICTSVKINSPVGNDGAVVLSATIREDAALRAHQSQHFADCTIETNEHCS